MGRDLAMELELKTNLLTETDQCVSPSHPDPLLSHDSLVFFCPLCRNLKQLEDQLDRANQQR